MPTLAVLGFVDDGRWRRSKEDLKLRRFCVSFDFHFFSVGVPRNPKQTSSLTFCGLALCIRHLLNLLFVQASVF